MELHAAAWRAVCARASVVELRLDRPAQLRARLAMSDVAGWRVPELGIGERARARAARAARADRRG